MAKGSDLNEKGDQIFGAMAEPGTNLFVSFFSHDDMFLAHSLWHVDLSVNPSIKPIGFGMGLKQFCISHKPV